MNRDDLFKRFFGFSSIHPESPYRGHDHGHDGFIERPEVGKDEYSDIFSDFHLEMHKQIEEMDRQMREIFRVFRIAEVPSTPAAPEGLPQQSSEANPRNFMLKDDDQHVDRNVSPSLPEMPDLPRATIIPPSHSRDVTSLFEHFFNIPHWNRVRPQDKVDSDLDDEHPRGSDLAKLLKEQEPVGDSHPKSGHFFHGNTINIQTFLGPDGKLEERRTVRDSSGREETTITRRIGDSSYTVTTIKDGTNQIQKQETFHNVDKDAIADFNKQWEKKKAITGPEYKTSVIVPQISSKSDSSFWQETKRGLQWLFGLDLDKK